MKKIEELTEKIYREGVEKGNAEAQRLIEEARQQAAQIVAQAQAEAQNIVAEAQKNADELSTNTRSELKLYAGQALNALKSEIVSVVSNKIVSEAVNSTVTAKDFLGKFLVALAGQWSANENIVISSADSDTLKAYFTVQAKELLDKGIKIEKINNKDVLFSIAPADGSYKVNFGKEEFENYFKEFLRPQLVEMLF